MSGPRPEDYTSGGEFDRSRFESVLDQHNTREEIHRRQGEHALAGPLTRPPTPGAGGQANLGFLSPSVFGPVLIGLLMIGIPLAILSWVGEASDGNVVLVLLGFLGVSLIPFAGYVSAFVMALLTLLVVSGVASVAEGVMPEALALPVMISTTVGCFLITRAMTRKLTG